MGRIFFLNLTGMDKNQTNICMSYLIVFAAIGTSHWRVLFISALIWVKECYRKLPLHLA